MLLGLGWDLKGAWVSRCAMELEKLDANAQLCLARISYGKKRHHNLFLQVSGAHFCID